MRRFHLVRALILLAPALFACGTASARDRALIVGVNHYPGLPIKGDPTANDLSSAVFDATTFRQLLVDYWHFDPSDIKFLVDDAATEPAILNAFEDWLIKGSSPGDRVVFYFAGHGAKVKVPGPGGVDRFTSTIVTASARYNGALEVSGMIEGRTIGQMLSRIRDRRIMVVADSCHSGSVTRGVFDRVSDEVRVRTISPRIPVNVALENWTQTMQSEMKVSERFIDIEPHDTDRPDAFVVWSATSVDQLAQELRNGGGGLFTQSLANGLRGKAASPDGSLTAGQLHSYVKEQSKEFCQKYRCMEPAPTPELQAPPAYRDLVLKPGSAPPPQNTASQAAVDASNLLGHKNDFGLKAEILPGPVVRTGTRVRFKVTSEEAGTLVVLDANADGSLRQIFPNAQSQQNGITGQVRAGSTKTIPDAQYGQVFVADTPGKGTLLVLVAEKALDLSGLLGKNLDSDAVQNPRALVVELATKVQAPLVTPDLNEPNRAYRWAFVAVPYETTR